MEGNIFKTDISCSCTDPSTCHPSRDMYTAACLRMQDEELQEVEELLSRVLRIQRDRQRTPYPEGVDTTMTLAALRKEHISVNATIKELMKKLCEKAVRITQVNTITDCRTRTHDRNR